MLAPARIPVAAGKKMANTEKNVSSRKSGPMFSHIILPERKIIANSSLTLLVKVKLEEYQKVILIPFKSQCMTIPL